MCARYSDRREFLAGMGLSAATLLWSGTLCAEHTQAEVGPHVAINQWSVGAMRGRDIKRPGMSLDEELAGLAACGINGLEPGLQTPEQAEALAAQLAKHGLEMRSVYTGSELLDPATTEKEIERILALAKREGRRDENHRHQPEPAAGPAREDRRAVGGPGRGPESAGTGAGRSGSDPGVP